MKTRTSVKKTREGGFSLIEVCLAVGITGICIASMQGLLPAGIRMARDTTEQTACATMLSAVSSDLRYTPSSSSVSPRYGINMPPSGQGGSTNLFLAGDGSQLPSATGARFGVTVSLTNAPSTTVSSLTTARIKVFWPAQSPADKPQGSVETVASFNRAMQLGGVYRTRVAYKPSQSSGSSGSGSEQSGTQSSSSSGSGGSCSGQESSSGGCSGGESSSGSGGCGGQTTQQSSGGCGGTQTQQSSGGCSDGHGGHCGSDRECGEDF
jgi:uncharacterized protein (TIGR02598 family)